MSLTRWSLSWTFSLPSKLCRFAAVFFFKCIKKKKKWDHLLTTKMSTEIMKWVFMPMCLRVKLGRNSGSRPTLWAAWWQTKTPFRKQVGKHKTSTAEAQTIRIIVLKGYIMPLPIFFRGSQGPQGRIREVKCLSFYTSAGKYSVNTPVRLGTRCSILLTR